MLIATMTLTENESYRDANNIISDHERGIVALKYVQLNTFTGAIGVIGRVEKECRTLSHGISSIMQFEISFVKISSRLHCDIDCKEATDADIYLDYHRQ